MKTITESLREFADIEYIETFYRGQSRIMTTRAEFWARVKRDMRPGETLQ